MDLQLLQLILFPFMLLFYALARRRDIAAFWQRFTEPYGGRGNTPPRHPTPAPNGSAGNPNLLADGRRWILAGAPGQGKSTAARQIVRSFLNAGAIVTVCDPDGSAWPIGAELVGSPDDYEAIGQTIKQLAQQATERRAQFQQGQRDFIPLLLVIDESPAVLRSTPGAIELISDLARRGRKLSISIVLLATDTQAKTLGLEGQTKLLDSFERLDCKMTPTGVELWIGDRLLTRAERDHHFTDLQLPVIAPTTVDADRLLAEALATPLVAPSRASSAMSATNVAPHGNAVLHPFAPLHESTQNPENTLPPDVARRIDSIDWRTVAELVAAGVVNETNALKALGFPPSSKSAKYKVARARLQDAKQNVITQHEIA